MGNYRYGKPNENLERNIRCNCGKFWGIKHFRAHKECSRCKTYVIARGPGGNRKVKQKKSKYRQSKNGTLTGY